MRLGGLLFLESIQDSIMAVTVKFFTTLRKAAGTNEVQIEAKSVGELIKKLKKQFRSNEKFLKQLRISNLIVNNTNVNFLKGRATKLSNGDVITLFPPLGGG